MKKVLIFGISRQDGAYLAQLFLNNGYDFSDIFRDARIANFSNLIKPAIHKQATSLSIAQMDFPRLIQRFNSHELTLQCKGA